MKGADYYIYMQFLVITGLMLVMTGEVLAQSKVPAATGKQEITVDAKRLACLIERLVGNEAVSVFRKAVYQLNRNRRLCCRTRQMSSAPNSRKSQRSSSPPFIPTRIPAQTSGFCAFYGRELPDFCRTKRCLEGVHALGDPNGEFILALNRLNKTLLEQAKSLHDSSSSHPQEQGRCSFHAW